MFLTPFAGVALALSKKEPGRRFGRNGIDGDSTSFIVLTQGISFVPLVFIYGAEAQVSSEGVELAHQSKGAFAVIVSDCALHETGSYEQPGSTSCTKREMLEISLVSRLSVDFVIDENCLKSDDVDRDLDADKVDVWHLCDEELEERFKCSVLGDDRWLPECEEEDLCLQVSEDERLV